MSNNHDLNGSEKCHTECQKYNVKRNINNLVFIINSKNKSKLIYALRIMVSNYIILWWYHRILFYNSIVPYHTYVNILKTQFNKCVLLMFNYLSKLYVESS